MGKKVGVFQAKRIAKQHVLVTEEKEKGSRLGTEVSGTVLRLNPEKRGRTGEISGQCGT